MPERTSDFRVDSHGRRRRLCGVVNATAETGMYDAGEHFKCTNYATRQLEDGTFCCNTHAPERKASWIMCAQPVAWCEKGAPTRTCQHRGRFLHREWDARAPQGEWRWYCKSHDPLRARCANVRAHPFDTNALPPPFTGRVTWFGPAQDPRTPTAVRRIAGVLLCASCVERHDVIARDRAEAAKKPPCTLCRGTKKLTDDEGRSGPCLCTADGRINANQGTGFYAPRPKHHRRGRRATLRT